MLRWAGGGGTEAALGEPLPALGAAVCPGREQGHTPSCWEGATTVPQGQHLPKINKSCCCPDQSLLSCQCLLCPGPEPWVQHLWCCTLVLLICHERSEARRGKPLQQRELKKAKLYKIKFLCSLSVVEDCHGNIFFFQRINSFSVNNVHRAAGERALFIYKIFIGDTFSLAPDSCKCFICRVLNHHKGGYYLGLTGIRRLSVLVGRVSCALFSSRKVFPESCSSSLEFRVFLQCLVLHQEQGSEALSGKQGDFGGRC